MKTLSIIIPVYNEEKTIKKIIDKVKNIGLAVKKEIVVVDDCSSDNSPEILKNIEGIRLILHNRNRGKGTAVRTALKYSTGDIIVIQDADMEYDPGSIPDLIMPILDKKTKVVYGSRFALKENQNWKIPLHYIGNRLLTLFTNLLYGSKITDMETCYKAFHRDVLDKIKLRARRFDFEPEITAKILKKGFKITEIPVRFKPRTFKQGKKITWIDGIKAMSYLLYYRFSD
ncbi:glycosyltransferase family 2 protein [Candidatus Woesearchaeota archaeon]|nr:glycosyltransferase family 2 protein [Candidatus Woesearchaeota archaeon]